MKLVIHFLLDTSNEDIYQNFQETFFHFPIQFLEISFSPLRLTQDNQLQGAITCKIMDNDFNQLKKSLSSGYDQIDNDFESYCIFNKMCHPNLYYILIQII